jgi:hypothetical protein
LTLYYVMGQGAAGLVNDGKKADSYSVECASRNLVSSLYIYRINIQTEKEPHSSSNRLMMTKYMEFHYAHMAFLKGSWMCQWINLIRGKDKRSIV